MGGRRNINRKEGVAESKISDNTSHTIFLQVIRQLILTKKEGEHLPTGVYEYNTRTWSSIPTSNISKRS